jgi:hypothetical protein
MTIRSSVMERDTHEDSMKIYFVFLWFFYKLLRILEVGANFCHLKEYEK